MWRTKLHHQKMKKLKNMTFPRILPAHPLQGLSNAIHRLKVEIADQRVAKSAYNKTFNELSAMPDNSLADIGICRGDIRQIAAEAAAMR